MISPEPVALRPLNPIAAKFASEERKVLISAKHEDTCW